MGVVGTAITDKTPNDYEPGDPDLYDLQCEFTGANVVAFRSDPANAGKDDPAPDPSTPRVTVCPKTDTTLLGARKGWKFALQGKGERVVTSALTASGLTLFATNTPPDYASASKFSCSSYLGEATIYNINYTGLVDPTNPSSAPSNMVAMSFPADGTTTAQGLLPSPVRVVVKIGEKTVEVVLFGTNPVPPKGLTYDRRIKKYWYKKIEAAKP
jgi:Tfp pilus tip-associated adhesin PilY1